MSWSVGVNELVTILDRTCQPTVVDPNDPAIDFYRPLSLYDWTPFNCPRTVNWTIEQREDGVLVWNKTMSVRL